MHVSSQTESIRELYTSMTLDRQSKQWIKKSNFPLYLKYPVNLHKRLIPY
jgi:hypothetical protein